MKLKQKIFYEDFYPLSDYPQDSKFFDLPNKKVIGERKDEFKRKIIIEFFGLKSKMYSFITADCEENKKAKGFNKNVKRIRHKEFVDVLFNKKMMRHKMKGIQSKLHRIGTYVCTILLSCFDDKGYILDDGIISLAYFHKDIKIKKNWVKSVKSIKLIKSNQIKLSQ